MKESNTVERSAGAEPSGTTRREILAFGGASLVATLFAPSAAADQSRVPPSRTAGANQSTFLRATTQCRIRSRIPCSGPTRWLSTRRSSCC
jgi:hypothetical protein